MSKQVQIRRGTAAQHESFIGAVGEITMDTDTNTLRVHDGQTPGGNPVSVGGAMPDDADYVVEFATGLSGANYSNGWYRKYKSGWVEQGGLRIQSSGSDEIVSLFVPLQSFVSPTLTPSTQSDDAGVDLKIYPARFSEGAGPFSNFTVRGSYVDGINRRWYGVFHWEVKGFAV